MPPDCRTFAPYPGIPGDFSQSPKAAGHLVSKVDQGAGTMQAPESSMFRPPVVGHVTKAWAHLWAIPKSISGGPLFGRCNDKGSRCHAGAPRQQRQRGTDCDCGDHFSARYETTGYEQKRSSALIYQDGVYGKKDAYPRADQACQVQNISEAGVQNTIPPRRRLLSRLNFPPTRIVWPNNRRWSLALLS